MRRIILALTVVAAVIGFVLVKQRAAPVAQPTRNDSAMLQPEGPTGTVLGAPTFRWRSPLQNARYRVTVRRGSTVVWIGIAETTEMSVPNTVGLEPGAEYSWQVEVINKEGEASMASPPQIFVIS